MGHNYEKEFFEHFESSSPKGQPLDPLSELFEADLECNQFTELGELILRFQDGDIDQSQFTRLQDWILNDRKARDYYVECAFIYAGLNILLNKKHDISWQQILLVGKS